MTHPVGFQHTLAKQLELLPVVVPGENFLHGDTTTVYQVMHTCEGLGEIIGQVFLPGVPLYVNILAFDLVYGPKEAHFPGA